MGLHPDKVTPAHLRSPTDHESVFGDLGRSVVGGWVEGGGWVEKEGQVEGEGQRERDKDRERIYWIRT